MTPLRWILCAALCLVALPAAAADSDATCTLTFDAVWSMATHPNAFPPNPHFSGLIGGTHNGDVVFWEGGALASAGVKSVAETGSKTLFEGEVQAAITAGTAETLISGGGIGLSPGSVAVQFSATVSHPEMTVISMIAPSPDWIVGTHGLPLFAGGSWITQQVVQLPPYDAGTDSGISYLSPNNPTVPPEPIAIIDVEPFPTSLPLGTFTVACVSPLVFLDGFESGDLDSWSDAIP